MAANFCRHCCYEFSEESKNGESLTPKIVSFEILDKDYCEGSNICVAWVVKGAKELWLNCEDVTDKSNCIYKVSKTRILILRAKNEFSEAHEEIILRPSRIACIVNYSANKTSVEYGDSIQLRWNDANKTFIQPGQKVQLQWACQHSVRTILRYDGNESEINNQGFLDISPAKSTIYSIVAYSVDNSIYDVKSIVVDVVEPVKIEKFETNHNQIIESSAVRLSWQVKNAEKVELYYIYRADISRMHLGITPKCEDVTGRNSIELRPIKDTEYRLHVSNKISSDDAYINISVHPLPKMDVSIQDVFTLPEFPTLNVELPDFTGNLGSSALGRWLTTEPLKTTNQSIWDRSILKKLPKLLKFRA